MLQNKSIVAIITARGGSKGVPRKNIKELCGKPLIAWTIEAALNSKYIDRVIVSTEDKEIEDISLMYGAEVPFLRPDYLSKDDSTSVDVVVYTVEKLLKDFKLKFDYIVLLQPTSPLRTASHIDESLESMFTGLSEFDALISVVELETPIYWNRRIGKNNELLDFSDYDKSKYTRRQDFDKLYRLNGAIYIVNTNKFLEEHKFELAKTKAFLMERKVSIDIDSMDDFELAEYYLSNSVNTK